MIEIFWITSLILFILTGVFLYRNLSKDKSTRNIFKTVYNGMRDGWKGCGFLFKDRRYTIELYEWVVCDDEEVCEDCWERSTWPAMDIADWMKEGLPGTPEAHTQCGSKCRCKLILSQKKTTNKEYHLP